MQEAGVATLPPDEVEAGGVDFTSRADLGASRTKLKRLHDEGYQLILHFAPPCSTFSTARNRARRTQLRSNVHPGGLPGLAVAEARSRVAEANAIALETFALAAWAHGELGAVVTLENPHTSYIWPFVEQSAVELGTYSDRVFSQCMYGTPYRKDTRLRVWGAGFHGMDRRCSSDGHHFACGRPVTEEHEKLGFGGASTSAAAAYPPGVCREWAQAVANLASAPTAAHRVVTTDTGPVRRHVDRGLEAESGAERRKREDHACRAGMRNPFTVVEQWPRLAQAMDPVYRTLRDFLKRNPRARDLWRACGPGASRRPPSEELITEARESVAIALHLTFNEA